MEPPIMPPMPDTKGTPGTSFDAPNEPCPAPLSAKDDAMVCERCGKAEMYRMHAVWRCPACGYKTDCCGW